MRRRHTALFAALLAGPHADRSRPAPPTADLVVLVAVDQLRPDYLDRFRPQLTDGFARLRANGVFFTEAIQDHALTETAPGRFFFQPMHKLAIALAFASARDLAKSSDVYLLERWSNGYSSSAVEVVSQRKAGAVGSIPTSYNGRRSHCRVQLPDGILNSDSSDCSAPRHIATPLAKRMRRLTGVLVQLRPREAALVSTRKPTPAPDHHA